MNTKAEQAWLFTSRFDVLWTNNGSEQAVRAVKVHQKISGCWKTLATLRRHCRIRSYLTNPGNHDIRPLTAIRDALTSATWMPQLPA